MKIEILGIIATLFILAGFCFKTNTFWGGFFLRFLNIIGSVVFVVYGILLPAYATAFLNGALIIVNVCFLIDMFIKKKKNKFNKID